MSKMLRVVMALGLALLGLVVVGQTPAYACSCVPSTVKQSLKRAEAVFVGTVTERSEGGREIVYKVRAKTAYKGDVDYSVNVSTSTDEATCGLDNLSVDEDYLFFAQGDGAVFTSGLCDGTTRATPAKLTKLEQFAEPVTVAVPPPPKPTLTPADTSEPTGFARLAAPGGAVAVVGLLGLLVVGRLSRR